MILFIVWFLLWQYYLPIRLFQRHKGMWGSALLTELVTVPLFHNALSGEVLRLVWVILKVVIIVVGTGPLDYFIFLLVLYLLRYLTHFYQRWWIHMGEVEILDSWLASVVVGLIVVAAHALFPFLLLSHVCWWAVRVRQTIDVSK